MKVTCSTQSLGQGLHVVSRAVSSRTTLPILNNVLMQTDPAGLRLTATNLEIGIKQVIPAEVQEEGSITVPARLLTDYVTAQPDASISPMIESSRNGMLSVRVITRVMSRCRLPRPSTTGFSMRIR